MLGSLVGCKTEQQCRSRFLGPVCTGNSWACRLHATKINDSMIDLVCILTLRHCPHARDALFDCSLAASCHEYGSVTAALANPGTCKNEVKTLGKPSILGKPSMSLRIDLCVFLLPGTPANFSVSLCKTSPVVAMLDRTPLLTLPPSAETCPTSCGYSSDLLDHSLIARYSSRCVGKSPAGRIPDFRACICSLSQLDKLPTSSCLHSWHGRIRRQLAFGLFPTSTRRRGSMQDLGLRSASSYSSRILRHQGTVENTYRALGPYRQALPVSAAATCTVGLTSFQKPFLRGRCTVAEAVAAVAPTCA